MSSLIERIKSFHPNVFDNTTDPNFPLWKQFVIDHKENIKQNSEKIFFTPEEMYDTRYKLRNFLNSKGIVQDLTWVILMINDLPNDVYFNKLESILIPENRYMYNLLGQFKTYIKSYLK